MNLELLSMEELSRIIRDVTETNAFAKLMREGAARELAKRENQLFHRSKISRTLTTFDYLG